MCGLVGFWDFKANTSKTELLAIGQKMGKAISHRGPDSEGAWCDETLGLSFSHLRLAIVDLSEAGHQPMVSRSGGSVIVYNGEIYNAPELRETLSLEGCRFRGHSDTEVILEACERWGVIATCQKLIGMFAFAFWDKQTQQLFLARDRLGIKPMYWGFNQGILFFGSQLKSFKGHPHFKPEIDKEALTAYFRFNYVPTPLSIFENIQKLSPGSILSIDRNQKTQEFRFWDLQDVITRAKENRLKASSSDGALVEECDVLLRDAVKRRMVADVPLGAFLSGGIDSSTVVALMQAQSDRPIKTFTIGFHEAGYDEAKHAAAVAKHLGTEHHELYLASSEAQAIIPDIPNWCDEPFADVSQIPTYLVSQLARQQVTVSLSGDGGDELFAGYNRYFVGQAFWQRIKILPYWLRYLSAYGIRQFSPNRWDSIAKILPNRFRPRLVGDKAHKLADILAVPNARTFYKNLVSYWEEPANLVLGGNEPVLYPWNFESTFGHSDDFVESMQMMDTLTYLPDDILTKVDRASMAVSLEARVPLLDHRVVEFAYGLPMDVKIRNGQGKWLLRQVLNKYVPNRLIDRPKMGFGVPIDQWLRGPLREWAENLLSLQRLESEGILNPGPICQRWREHLSGQRNWQYSLWGVLMFQAWQERWAL
ncbi:MAG: asparagine synthase (glutamine-hydrolyzing) [Gammaproteobacteria bacterium]|nr:asparagine synthase (glutamine-hydrolyzing) [Gammaproteobacteria bacterium]